MSKRNRKGKGLDEKKIKLLTAIIAAIGTLYYETIPRTT